MVALLRIYTSFLALLNALSPVMLLILRLWMARIWWQSGMVKISDWSNTIYLFTNEHPVPHLPPQIAAVFATSFELCCPVLLTLGLASRLATLPMLAMTGVIYFTYDTNIEHIYWAMLLGTILLVGPGKLSLDYFIKCKVDRHGVSKH